MPKNIVFCADGTWNSPSQDCNDDDLPDYTNVYKLFLLLRGTASVDAFNADNEREKVDTSGVTGQVAKYINGVGDSKNPVVQWFEGACGSGTVTRLVRGYTFISRNYEPGDRIFIVGFSRGAYTARALADFIANKGLLAKGATDDKEKAYRKGAAAWRQYREGTSNASFFARLVGICKDLPAFLSSERIADSELVAVDRIAAVGVWDTVGALGLPIFVGSERYDAFKFTGNKLNKKVEWGFQAVSLDDDRSDFTPSLWCKRERIKQLVFPGAHADVGGGYPIENRESELSDVPLQWMLDELKKVGLLLSDEKPFAFNPDPAGTAHVPWRKMVHMKYTRECEDLMGHCSIALRSAAAAVLPDPRERQAPYRPANKPANICQQTFTPCACCRFETLKPRS